MPSRDVDAYIRRFPPRVRTLLQKIRTTACRAAPKAQEVISYRMPALRQNGILLYYAAFKGHIGLFPPVRGDASLLKATAKYAGPKGNLRFPYDQPIPYGLIGRIVKQRVKQEGERQKTKDERQKTRSE